MDPERIKWHEQQAAFHRERAEALKQELRGAELPRVLPRRPIDPRALPASFFKGTDAHVTRRFQRAPAKPYFPRIK